MARHMSGWVKLHRALLDHDMIKDHLLFATFCWLLLSASRQQAKAKLNGEWVILAPGQIVTGLDDLASELGAARSSVRRRLESLVNLGTITQNVGHGGRVITINNWGTYQDNDRKGGTSVEHERNVDGTSMERRWTHMEKREERREKEEESHKSSPVAPTTSPRELAECWNVHKSANMPAVDLKAFASGSKRWNTCRSRLAEKPDLGYWVAVVKRIAASPFCRGDNGRSWRANFDFLIRPDTHIKAMEGSYGGAAQSNWEDRMAKFLAKGEEDAAG